MEVGAGAREVLESSGLLENVDLILDWTMPLSPVPSCLERVAHCLFFLCLRIQALSKQTRLHPRKCFCLFLSYSFCTLLVLSLISPVFPSSPHLLPEKLEKLDVLLTALLHILEEGERFLQDCTFQKRRLLFLPCSARKQRKWLIDKALPIALSTEIFDVHLHDLMWCISTLIWFLSDYGDASIYYCLLATLDTQLGRIWASADEHCDAKSMQELFSKIGTAKRHEKLCNLIRHRLCEQAKLNLTNAVVPTYLWMDPRGFEDMRGRVLGSSEFAVVFPTRLMGGIFACKHIHNGDSAELFAKEAAIQARLWHANVVHLVCCKTEASESNSLVMELMDQNLGSLISERRSNGMDEPFSLLGGVDIMLQIAKGMENLHDSGIMHRDLKSFNILLSCRIRPWALKESDEIVMGEDFKWVWMTCFNPLDSHGHPHLRLQSPIFT